VPITETVQRRRVSRKKGDAQIIRLQLKDHLGNPRWATADLLNISEDGIGISILTPLGIGSKIVVRGKLGESRSEVVSAATVLWCAEKINGIFHAGLELGDRSAPANGSAQRLALKHAPDKIGVPVQRRRVSRKKSDAQIIRLQLKDYLGNPKWITADLLDTSEDGIGISVMTPLGIGSKIVVRGKFGEGRSEVVSAATVLWCAEKINGIFHAGLELEDRSSPRDNSRI
jgi:hypothetical protein